MAHDIIAIGASSGGVDAILKLAGGLPADLGAAVFVVLHTGPHRGSRFADLVNAAGPLAARYPEDGEPIAKNRIYVAPPDYHMLLRRDRIAVTRGPKENFTRPAIDPLFRSAAIAHGPRAIGVVLTGGLDDGTAGLVAIKARGGIAVVQDPDDAYEPSMPRSALRYVAVDHAVPLTRLPSLLAELVRQPSQPDKAFPVPDWLEAEDKIAEAQRMKDQETLLEFGDESPLSCPECGGVLYQRELGALMRFRCRVGHAYTADTLLTQQSSGLEAALWSGVRALEENALLAQQLAERQTRRNGTQSATELRALARRRREEAARIRRFLEQAKEDEPPAARGGAAC